MCHVIDNFLCACMLSGYIKFRDRIPWRTWLNCPVKFVICIISWFTGYRLWEEEQVGGEDLLLEFESPFFAQVKGWVVFLMEEVKHTCRNSLMLSLTSTSGNKSFWPSVGTDLIMSLLSLVNRKSQSQILHIVSNEYKSHKLQFSTWRKFWKNTSIL